MTVLLQVEKILDTMSDYSVALWVEVERAWARRPGPNSLTVNKAMARRAWFFKKLGVGSSWKFSVVLKEKLGLEAGSMEFFIGSGSALNAQVRSTTSLLTN